MTTTCWTRGPVGLDAGARLTATGCRNVLVMVPTLTAGTRLMDLVPLFDGDFRVQVSVTVPHGGDVWHGLEEFVRRSGMVALPWDQARRHEWDLVLSASHRHIDQVHGNVLVLPHGAGSRMSRRFSRKAGKATRPTTGLDRELLTCRGRVIPSVLALPHEQELLALQESCPEAMDVAVVTGDLCLDRMLASAPSRAQYRAALGVGEHQRLVTVSSTWSKDSTLGKHPELYDRLLTELSPDDFRVAAVLHPNIWAVHGSWQVRSWLAAAVGKGLLVIPPEHGWQASMIASDQVLGDFGSTTSYAAAVGVPVLLAAFPDHAIRSGSIADLLAAASDRLDHSRGLAEQVLAPGRRARAHRFVEVLSSAPGDAAARFRRAMYRLLDIAEPSWPARPQRLALPAALRSPEVF